MLSRTFLASIAWNHRNQPCPCVSSVCSSSSRMEFDFAVEFERNPIMTVPHLAGEDRVARNIPVTSSGDIDYLLPADMDGRVVGGTEAGSSRLCGETRDVGGNCPGW